MESKADSGKAGDTCRLLKIMKQETIDLALEVLKDAQATEQAKQLAEMVIRDGLKAVPVQKAKDMGDYVKDLQDALGGKREPYVDKIPRNPYEVPKGYPLVPYQTWCAANLYGTG